MSPGEKKLRGFAHPNGDPNGGNRQCVAHNRAGKRCKQWAIPGGTVCHYHGGATGHIKRKAAERVERARVEAVLEEAVATLGLPRDVDPAQALLEEVQRSAGIVAWLADVVGQLEQETVTKGVKKIVRLPDGEQRTEVEAGINVWVKLYGEERDRLHRVAKMALDAGVAERQVQIAEGQAELMAGAIRKILGDLGVGDHPDAPRIVRDALTNMGTIEGSAKLLNARNRS